MLAAPPVAKPHGAPEPLTADVSAATTPQGNISCASLTSAATSILDSSDSRLSSGGLETSEKSKPLSEELAVLREGLAELQASIAEQTGNKHSETFVDSPAVLVLQRGLIALERVWASEGSSCA